MGFILKKDDLQKIDSTLGATHKAFEASYTWSLKSPDNAKPMVFTIYDQVDLGGGLEGALVSVQTRHGYYELHNINNLMFFEPDEIILISSTTEFLSCLIIGSSSTCSLYSNISRSLLRSDFSELHPAVLLSAMQLSITDSIVE